MIDNFNTDDEMYKYFKNTLGAKHFTQMKLFGQLSLDLQELFIETYTDETVVPPKRTTGLVFKPKN